MATQTNQTNKSKTAKKSAGTNGRGRSGQKAPAKTSSVNSKKAGAANKQRTAGKSGKKTDSKSVDNIRCLHEEDALDRERYERLKTLRDEIILMITLVISILLFLSNFELSGSFGRVINTATFGLFGALAYVVPVLLFLSVAFYLANHDQKGKYIFKLLSFFGLFMMLAAMIQMIIGGVDRGSSLLTYYAVSAVEKTGGGIIGGVMCYLLTPVFGTAGTYVLLIAAILIFIMMITGKTLFAALAQLSEDAAKKRKERREKTEEEEFEEDLEEQRSTMFEDTPIKLKKRKHRTVPEVAYTNTPFYGGFTENGQLPWEANKPETDKPEINEQRTSEPGRNDEAFYTQTNKEPVVSIFEEELNRKFSEPMREITPPDANVFYREPKKHKQNKELPPEVLHQELPEKPLDSSYLGGYVVPTVTVDPLLQYTKPQDVSTVHQSEIPKVYDNYENKETFSEPVNAEPEESSYSETMLLDKKKEQNSAESKAAFARTPYGKLPVGEGVQMNISDVITKQPPQQPPQPVTKPYAYPPIDLLAKPKGNTRGMSDTDLKSTAMKLQSTLESFGVKVSVTNVSCGPSVTRYELQPEQGVKVSRITNLADDIKLNLAAADVRIEAPIPGKAAVGIEVPNKENITVSLRSLIEGEEFKKHPSKLAFSVGKDIGGQNIVTDIAKMPHLLIAGATGSGKSVCINTLIVSLLYKSDPTEVRMIMVDPKVVELSVYNGIPHLLIPVVTDPKKASAALNWAVNEMTERYQKFAESGVRDIKGYNEKIQELNETCPPEEKQKKLPQIVIIVDELADLMMVAPGEVEDAICRLAQLARAAGLHLVIATQRPSVNVITGLIKANIPSRIAFAVSSQVDSRTIIDGAGAEKLLGKGDMLFFPAGYPKPVRLQGAFVSDKEVTAVVDFLKTENQGIVSYHDEIAEKISTIQNGTTQQTVAADDERDVYFAQAGRFIIENEKASIGMLQRVYKIGFNRAARIMDQLTEAGVVGPEDGKKPREILMTLDEFMQICDE